jgi:hypothetical protein
LDRGLLTGVYPAGNCLDAAYEHAVQRTPLRDILSLPSFRAHLGI